MFGFRVDVSVIFPDSFLCCIISGTEMFRGVIKPERNIDTPYFIDVISDTIEDEVLDETEKAFKAYDRVLEVVPDNTLVLNNYAYYLSLRKESLEKAKNMALHAVELDPNNAVYLDTYAWVLYQKGEYEAAETQMEKAIRLLKAPEKTYYQHYADILTKVNKLQEAEKYRNKAQNLPDAK